MENKASMKEYVICNLILVASMVGAFFAGLSEIFVFLLIPSCITYIFVRFKLKYSLIPIALTFVLPSLMAMSLEVSMLVLSLPIAVMIGAAIKRKKGLLYTVSYGVVGEIISVALIVAISYFTMQSPVAADTTVGQFSAAIDTAMNAAMEAYQIPAEQKGMIYDMFTALLPSMLICTMTMFSYLTFYICIAVLKRRDTSYVGLYRPFSEIKADKMSVLAVVVFFIISTFTDGAVAKAFVNIVIILVFFMFVCGLSTMIFFAKTIRKRGARIAIYILMAVTIFITSSIFMFIGLLDAFIDVRRLTQRAK